MLFSGIDLLLLVTARSRLIPDVKPDTMIPETTDFCASYIHKR
jgi:hypothetical protein